MKFVYFAAYLEALLEILVLLQESRVVDDDLCIRYPKFQDLVIYRFSCLYSADGLFKIHIERPQLQRLEESCLCREGLEGRL